MTDKKKEFIKPENVPEKFLKPYDPKATEKKIYELWEKSGFFNPDNLPIGKDAEPFSIVLPPPNVTGTLHTGHAIMLAIEDIMIRFERLRGKRTLWLPGTDHAAIATQSKVEGEIYKKEGKRRHDLGREELLKRVEQFAKESHDRIVNQVRRMGSSVDWSREAFTLDEKRTLAVRTAFKQMYEDGLIYRGHRIVNWDPKGQTTISDDEIVYKTEKTKLYTFKYAKDFPISISTTRPETKLGDQGVAVHPEDERYKKYIGQTFKINFVGQDLTIKVIADNEVNPEFGTGAVGITPTHSHIDWEMAIRHKLPTDKIIINEQGKMIVGTEKIIGKKVSEARNVVVDWLKENNLLEKEEDIEHNIATAERTGGVIEPMPKLQWFIAVNKPIEKHGNKTLKQLMQGAVSSGQVKILPDHFEKIYFHWIDNLRDWCISRQIWYGHRIPVWYRTKNSIKVDKGNIDTLAIKDNLVEMYCDIKPPSGKIYTVTDYFDSDGWTQDPDTLDTWFSSGLWTFSTLGWPEKTIDLKTFHPTSVLETGYDILFFWVARMILMSTYLLGEVPFKTVYLHGLVRDGQGRKMSKSLGNIMDPVDMIDKFGTDALRLAMIIGTSPGSDSKLSEDKIRGYKNFANKLWNIARFILEKTSTHKFDREFNKYTENDEALRKERHELLAQITKEMTEYKFYLVGEKLYHYTWHTFADKILEDSKSIFESGSDIEKDSRAQFLLHTLQRLLIALHPFIPFVTEEIWQNLPKEITSDKLLMVAKWPI